LVQNIAVIVQTTGYLEKLSFCPNSALRMKILSSEYQLGLRKNFHARHDFEQKS